MTGVCLQYNKDLSKVFAGVKIDLQSIQLLDPEGRENLVNFANTGVGQINFAAYLAEVTCQRERERERDSESYSERESKRVCFLLTYVFMFSR